MVRVDAPISLPRTGVPDDGMRPSGIKYNYIKANVRKPTGLGTKRKRDEVTPRTIMNPYERANIMMKRTIEGG